MTAAHVITDRVRPLVDDTGSNRWSDALLITYLNDGVRLVTDNLPESLLSNAYTRATLAEATVIGSTLSVDERYRGALADYVCARAFLTDGQDRYDLARAALHARNFADATGIVFNVPMPRG